MDVTFPQARPLLRQGPDLEGLDADDTPPHAYGEDAPCTEPPVTQGTAVAAMQALQQRGQVLLDSALLRKLRQTRLMSQQDLADDCWRRNIQISIATIKRAEAGRAVRFRIARELARYFDLPQTRLLRG